jgi:hypothetical protein
MGSQFKRWDTPISASTFVALEGVAQPKAGALEVTCRVMAENGLSERYRFLFSDVALYRVVDARYLCGQIIESHFSDGPTLISERPGWVLAFMQENYILRTFYGEGTAYTFVLEGGLVDVLSLVPPSITTLTTESNGKTS